MSIKSLMVVVIAISLAFTFGGAVPAQACCDCFYIGGGHSGQFCGCGLNTGFGGCRMKQGYAEVCIQTGGACGAA